MKSPSQSHGRMCGGCARGCPGCLGAPRRLPEFDELWGKGGRGLCGAGGKALPPTRSPAPAPGEAAVRQLGERLARVALSGDGGGGGVSISLSPCPPPDPPGSEPPADETKPRSARGAGDEPRRQEDEKGGGEDQEETHDNEVNEEQERRQADVSEEESVKEVEVKYKDPEGKERDREEGEDKVEEAEREKEESEAVSKEKEEVEEKEEVAGEKDADEEEESGEDDDLCSRSPAKHNYRDAHRSTPYAVNTCSQSHQCGGGIFVAESAGRAAQPQQQQQQQPQPPPQPARNIPVCEEAPAALLPLMTDEQYERTVRDLVKDPVLDQFFGMLESMGPQSGEPGEQLLESKTCPSWPEDLQLSPAPSDLSSAESLQVVPEWRQPPSVGSLSSASPGLASAGSSPAHPADPGSWPSHGSPLAALAELLLPPAAPGHTVSTGRSYPYPYAPPGCGLGLNISPEPQGTGYSPTHGLNFNLSLSPGYETAMNILPSPESHPRHNGVSPPHHLNHSPNHNPGYMMNINPSPEPPSYSQLNHHSPNSRYDMNPSPEPQSQPQTRLLDHNPPHHATHGLSTSPDHAQGKVSGNNLGYSAFTGHRNSNLNYCPNSSYNGYNVGPKGTPVQGHSLNPGYESCSRFDLPHGAQPHLQNAEATPGAGRSAANLSHQSLPGPAPLIPKTVASVAAATERRAAALPVGERRAAAAAAAGPAGRPQNSGSAALAGAPAQTPAPASAPAPAPAPAAAPAPAPTQAPALPRLLPKLTAAGSAPAGSAKARLLAQLQPDVKCKAWASVSVMSVENLTSGDQDGDTPLMILVSRPHDNQLELLYALVERLRTLPGALATCNRRGQSALYVAALQLPQKPLIAAYIAEALLDLGEDLAQMRYGRGETLLEHIRQRGSSHSAVLRELAELKGKDGRLAFPPLPGPAHAPDSNGSC